MLRGQFCGQNSWIYCLRRKFDSNMQILRENWKLYVGKIAKQILFSRSGLAIQTKQLYRCKRKVYRDLLFVLRGFARTTSHQYRTPEYIRPFVGPTGFPDFGRRGWTNQADRLPWRPYGLIRANIISEDARKNRRISENSFGQRSLGFFPFLLPSFFPPSLGLRSTVRLIPSQEKKCLRKFRESKFTSHNNCSFRLLVFREKYSLFVHLIYHSTMRKYVKNVNINQILSTKVWTNSKFSYSKQC